MNIPKIVARSIFIAVLFSLNSLAMEVPSEGFISFVVELERSIRSQDNFSQTADNVKTNLLSFYSEWESNNKLAAFRFLDILVTNFDKLSGDLGCIVFQNYHAKQFLEKLDHVVLLGQKGSDKRAPLLGLMFKIGNKLREISGKPEVISYINIIFEERLPPIESNNRKKISNLGENSSQISGIPGHLREEWYSTSIPQASLEFDEVDIWSNKYLDTLDGTMRQQVVQKRTEAIALVNQNQVPGGIVIEHHKDDVTFLERQDLTERKRLFIDYLVGGHKLEVGSYNSLAEALCGLGSIFTEKMTSTFGEVSNDDFGIFIAAVQKHFSELVEKKL